MSNAKTCAWRPWRMGEGAPAQWRTSCGSTLGISTMHSPAELGFEVCPFCAKPIRVEKEEANA